MGRGDEGGRGYKEGGYHFTEPYNVHLFQSGVLAYMVDSGIKTATEPCPIIGIDSKEGGG